MAAPKEAKHGVSSKTLFVRNLPYTVTDQQLENVFTDIGPVKRCFIVRKKGEESSRGFGYVTFALLEDANKALKKRLFLEGRKLLVHVADKRQVDEKAPGKKKKKKEESEFEFEDESEEETEDQSQKQDREDRKRSHQEKKYLRSITLVLTGFRKGSTLSDISTLVQDIKTLSKIIYPVDEEGEAHLRFKSIRDTRRAERKLNNKQVGDITLKAVQLSECHKLPRDIKRCRLIIRNLSFKCKPPDLKKIFSKFGEVLETNIPTKPNGLMRGFGFVQFSDLVSADDAVNSMNGKNIFDKRKEAGIEKEVCDWRILSPKHAMQIDGRSCGVYVLLMAECFLKGKNLQFIMKAEDVLLFRKVIACKLMTGLGILYDCINLQLVT